MFSQFRTALESVAQQPIRILDAAPSAENGATADTRSSLDIQGRKQFSTPRGSLTNSSAGSPTVRKSTLEERLRRAAQAPVSGDTSRITTPKPGASTSVIRGRTGPSASQATPPSHRTISPSPASSRSMDVLNSASSRGTSPAPATRTPSHPPCRASSPVPVARVASRPPSRTASPAVARTPSLPPSRAPSPAASARTRASELKSTRASSPSPIARNQSPLRRASVALDGKPVATSSLVASSSSESSDSSLEEAQSDGSAERAKVENYEGTATMLPLVEQVRKSEANDEASVSPTDRENEITSETLSRAEKETPLCAVQLELVTLADIQAIDPVPPPEPELEVLASSETSFPHTAQHRNGESVSGTEPLLAAARSDIQVKNQESAPFASQPRPAAVAIETVDSSTTLPNISEALRMVSQGSQHYSSTITNESVEIEALQEKLKEVEQRFSDVSTSFKQLRAEKLAADAVLKENSPLESFTDPAPLREYFANLKIKDEVFQEDIKRLTGRLELQDEHFEELREIHDRESRSHSDEIRKLKTQLADAEGLFKAAQRATTNVESAADKQKEEVSRLEKELVQARDLAKEEEEKRVKAITLLKTVRQKLVKAEKDKEDMVREMATFKEREKGEKDKEQAERLNIVREMDLAQAAHAQEVAFLKSQFEMDVAGVRDRLEQELSALRGQQELDIATSKALFSKELTAKSSQIAALESSLNRVSRDKAAYFEQLQVRQAQVESAQAALESLQHHKTELEYQLREANDHLALLREEYADLQREAETRSREPVTSADEIAHMVSAVEGKYEAKLTEMKRNVSVLEKERHDSETDWSKKLKVKVQELEDMKRLLGSATRLRENEGSMVAGLKAELDVIQKTSLSLQREVEELPVLRERIQEMRRTSVEHEQEVKVKIRVLEKQIEEHKTRETGLKQAYKNILDELRKVQSSAALLERQRNPGVGYWGTRGTGGSEDGTSSGSFTANESRVSISSPVPADINSMSPAAKSTQEEEVNLEYIRNIILQFLEHKEMRPHLVKVLSIILHFTPQETRRLIAKV